MSKQKKTDKGAQEQTGRESNGQFAPGNGIGPGNPFGRRVAQLRQAALNVVSDKDVEEVFASVLALAKAGNLQAAKLILSYTLGKPAPVENPDTMDHQELEQAHEGTQLAGAAIGTAESYGAERGAQLVRVASYSHGLRQAQVLAKTLRQGYVDPADFGAAAGDAGFGPHRDEARSGLGEADEMARVQAQIRRAAAEARAAQRKDDGRT